MLGVSSLLVVPSFPFLVEQGLFGTGLTGMILSLVKFSVTRLLKKGLVGLGLAGISPLPADASFSPLLDNALA